MNKLMHGEASRILAVLDQSVLFMDLLAHVPERNCLEELHEELEEAGCAGVIEALKQLQMAEIRFVKASRGTSKEQIERSTSALHEAARELCRHLRHDSRATDLIISWKREQDRELEPEHKLGEEKDDEPDEATLEDLVQTLRQFRKDVQSKLSTTVEQTQAKRDFFLDIKLRIETQEEELQQIKSELRVEAEKEKELERQKDSIDKLWSSINEVRAAYDKEMAEITSQRSEKNGGLVSEHTERRKDALDRFDKACEAFMAECSAHQEMEESLRKRMNRGHAEINVLIDEYDRVLLAKRREHDRLKRLHTDEAERLAVLSEYFRKVDRDLANEAEEERLIAEELARIAAKKKEKDDAAARIQALYRGTVSRRMVRKKRKKKAGKKKKKKK